MAAHTTHHRPPVAITQGDAAGIGPEVVVRALQAHPEWLAGCVVVGDLLVWRRALAVCDGHWTLQPMTPAQAMSPWSPAHANTLRVVVTSSLTTAPAYGRIDAQSGHAAAHALTWAAQAALAGQVAAVVTAPIHKEAWHAAGYPYAGHTDMLQALAATHAGCCVTELPVRMMLSNAELRTVLVSIHISLRQAIEAVTQSSILQTLQVMHRHAHGVAAWPRCRMAVAGLNPHAGEGGLMGHEERTVIAPAIAMARAQGMDVHGPFAPDTIFMRARQGEFDVVVAMYHDQGLIPVKYMGLAEGVNTTLGLPFVRTSPDHGTAFDLAGTGRADPSSMIHALRQAFNTAETDGH